MQPIGKLIYVASPYTSPIRAVEEARNTNVAVAMGYLMNAYPNLSFFSPICHTHPIAALCNLRGDWEYWKRYDEAMLSRSDEIWVLCLDGVEESKGVNAELELAKTLGLEVWYIHPQIDGSYIRVGWGFASPDVR
jgi:hypothetical protein